MAAGREKKRACGARRPKNGTNLALIIPAENDPDLARAETKAGLVPVDGRLEAGLRPIGGGLKVSLTG